MQGLGGFNDGLGESSNQFMQIIHGIMAFQDTVTIGINDFLEGLGIIGSFFGG
jgi:hypothetical protein